MSVSLAHIHFKSPDPEKTARFYIDTLGATVVSRNENPEGRVSYRLDFHGIPMSVSGLVAGQALEQFWGLEHIAMNAPEFDAKLQELKDGGAKILEERRVGQGRRVAFFEGPEGVRLEIMEGAG